ncbi:MAG: GDP-mannose 4,6-dehydratase [Parcubacteria group bacterium]|nr:GDP-mannose 4,6-dehydratase [Parcubacteria group bacterium]
MRYYTQIIRQKIRRFIGGREESNDASLPPKILITGGLGFIFSHVTEYFVAKGWRVVVIDNLSEGSRPEIIDGSFKLYREHMADPKVINIILDENPDYVIHASAITDVDYSVREPYRTLRKNILSTLHAFEACRNLPNLKKLIYVSTDEVYGECDHQMKEGEIILPKNPYSCAKAAGSLIRTSYDNTYPVLKGKTAETRFCNVFGPRQDPAKIMSAIKKSIETGYSIPLHQEGTGYREYIYVKNIPSAVDLILEKGLGVFNVTLNDGFTVKNLIEKAREVTGLEIKTHPSHRPGMDMKYQMDGSRMRELGWKPLYTFEEGLKEYLCEK